MRLARPLGDSAFAAASSSSSGRYGAIEMMRPKSDSTVWASASTSISRPGTSGSCVKRPAR